MSEFRFTFPDVGQGLSEAEILEWKVKPGDWVREGQIIVVVETDKASVEIPSPVSGVVKELGGAVGDVVRVGEILLVVEVEDREMEGPERGDLGVTAESARPRPGDRVLAAPVVRRLAKELGVDLRSVRGTGVGGRITREDVEAAATGLNSARGESTSSEAGATATAEPSMEERAEDRVAPYPEPPAKSKIVPLRGIRREIALNLTRAWQEIPHITAFYQVEATELVRLYRQIRSYLEPSGVKFGYTAFFVKAVVAALKKHPSFNARLDMEKKEIVYLSQYHIGIATATVDGLIVPVVHQADTKSLVQIAREIEHLSNLAGNRRLSREQLLHGTFTVTNYGSLGAWLGTPIIRPGEVAIAGFGRIYEGVIAVDGTPSVRPLLPVSVATDHRVNDGDALAAFVETLVGFLREPARLLAEV
jgi:pyruvate dehydrogenase E2 component (dihydrolipoamide acetyltransferase)